MNTPFEPHSGGWSGVPVLPPAWEAERLGGGWIPDFSGWIEPFFPQPGEVVRPTKGNPVAAPGNPEGQQPGAIQSAIIGALRLFVPSRQQMRDVLVYGGAAVLVGIAIWRAI